MDENVNILELQVKCQKLFTQIVRSYPIMPGLVIIFPILYLFDDKYFTKYFNYVNLLMIFADN